MVISRLAVNEYLERDLRSYLWIKECRRRELEAELSHFRVRPQFKTAPWLHQLACFLIAMTEPRFLFLLDMGLGKSKILLDILTQRVRERKAQRGIIFVPNVVNMESWKDDALRHSNLEPWACDVANIEEKWERLVDPSGDFTVIDYQGFMLATCTKQLGKKKNKLAPNERRIRQLQKIYDFVGLDESHKLRNNQSLWFEVVQQMCVRAEHVYATTGTVFGKNPESMWSQFRLVDGGETFGENLALFRHAFFVTEESTFATNWVFRRSMTPELHKMMQHKSIRYDEKEIDELELPTRMPAIIKRMQMGAEQREHYLRALEGLINAQGAGDPSLMDAPWTRMRQIVSGYLVFKDEHGEHTIRFKENPKMEAVAQVLEELGTAKIVICHYYTETGRMLVDNITKLGYKCEWLHGGTKDKVATRRRFLEDPRVQVFVMNTEAGGTGNDGLQKVASYMLFYESPTPPDVRKQVEKRIHRPGQKERTFFIDLVMKRSMDQTILDNIAQGADLYDAVVNGRKMTRSLLGG